MANQWANLATKHKGGMLHIAKKATIDMGKNIIRMSPVDTGLFQGTWKTSLNQPDTSIDESEGAGLLPVVKSAKIGDTIFFTNSQPYAFRLEYGWSNQAPFGMVRVTIADFQGFINRANTLKRVPLR